VGGGPNTGRCVNVLLQDNCLRSKHHWCFMAASGDRLVACELSYATLAVCGTASRKTQHDTTRLSVQFVI